MITDQEFTDWLRAARPGEWITYHSGQHLFGINGTKKTAAALAFRAAEQGAVFICQRRVVEGEGFDYRALRLDERLQRRMKSWRFK